MNNRIMHIEMYNGNIIYILLHDTANGAYSKAKSDWCGSVVEFYSLFSEYIKFEFDGTIWYYYDSYKSVSKYQRHHFIETDITKIPYKILKKLYKDGSYYYRK